MAPLPEPEPSTDPKGDVLLNDVARVRMPQDFLTFCIDQRANNLHDGTQKRGAVTCSNTVQGVLPASDRMVSTVILTPANGARIAEGVSFNVTIRSANINYGFFNNPDVAYYAQPQTLDAAGNVQGHQHITVQALPSAETPPDALAPVFFKGLNGEAGDGTLSVEVTGGIRGVGEYRICTMTASAGHQPVLMPVARRGAQDDCIRIQIVGGSGNGNGNGNGNGSGNGGSDKDKSNTVDESKKEAASVDRPKAVDVSARDIARARPERFQGLQQQRARTERVARRVRDIVQLRLVQLAALQRATSRGVSRDGVSKM